MKDMTLTEETIALLKNLIATPSFSREEDQTARLIEAFLENKGIPFLRKGNNIWARNKHFKTGQTTYLLNSHHDTVKPVKGWQRDPFEPSVEDGILYGLGSNDAGASLVSLLATFIHFYDQQLPFNLIFAASAEEEISGRNGIEALLPELGHIDAGIVGEPTEMHMAIAEKGLMVIDGEAKGKAGHAARNEGINALYIALEDIEILRNFEFEDQNSLVGKTKISVTQIQAGIQHNVVPDSCKYVVDVRTNELLPNKEVFDILQSKVQSTLTARSFRLNSSRIAEDHPLVQSGKQLGRTCFGSPTLSDQALMSFPTLKMGCGDSARSHTADEFIYLKEIEEGIKLYIQLLENLI
jgi:acetylornithine deacetylase